VKIIRMFLMNKEQATCGDSRKCCFAVMSDLGKEPTMLHGGDFSDAKTIAEQLSLLVVQDIEVDDSNDSPPQWDLADAVSVVTQNMYIHHPDNPPVAGSDIPPLYLTRLVMFITKSRSSIKLTVNEELKKIMGNPLFFVDVIYLHEDRSDENIVELNWSILSQFIDMQQGRGYILECGPDVTDWHNKTACLLPNPTWRATLSELQRKRGKVTATNGDASDEAMDENDPNPDLISLT